MEGAAILASVAIVVFVTAMNDWQKQQKFAELEQQAEAKHVTVLRGGRREVLKDSCLVVGDLLCLEGGQRLSVDGVLVSGSSYVCDESALTGEGEEVPKGDTDPFFLSGSSIVEGADGCMLVLAVGPCSFSGGIALATRAKKKQTPLEEKLEDLAEKIGKCGLGAATLTFCVLAVKETYVIYSAGQSFSFLKYWEMLTTAVAIVVVAVPEGLPLSVTIALAYSMRQMLEDKNLVRHLVACETMGGATCICTDKTGTLTTNDLGVVSLQICGRRVEFARSKQRLDDCFDRIGRLKGPAPEEDRLAMPEGVPLAAMQTFFRAVALSSAGEHNRTALAILQLLSRMGYDVGQAQAQCTADGYRRYPFSSARKESSCLFREESGTYFYVKGASEVILQRCQHWLDAKGAVSPLSALDRQNADQAVSTMAGEGLRTLCIAYGQYRGAGPLPQKIPAAADVPLVCIGFVGIEEPVRPEVNTAIRTCLAAGIRVKMVTGDNRISALTVAQRCGIYSEGMSGRAMEGREFRELYQKDPCRLVALLPSLVVLARATPLDKQQLVELLKRDCNAVVAVTGDGTNDAPALKAADVGFAMNSGTEVAKGASDIILTDDNFVGVVKAVLWGRNVNDNIRKFIQFQLTVNCAACAIAVIGAVMSSSNLSPLKPVQLLWLNLIMDSLAALGLATELPSPDLLHREPLVKDAPIISPHMWLFILGQGAYQLFVNLFLLLKGHELFATSTSRPRYFDDTHLTAVFNTFVLMQVFNFFNARLLGADLNVFRELHRSKLLVSIAVLIAALQVLMINYGGRFFSVVPLTFEQWVTCIGLGAASLPVGVGLRMYRTRRYLGFSPRLRNLSRSVMT
eukprot:TRINITY_DN5811_c0_g1_i1.p1 TRINITY_DN5811_c0_g1~~TRINITY_DN5811_c0_g1_i1.p1  ORF type:complete len:993 (+),score=373.81 TRINITY_DN5811_c0_g1_i1:420-2981(+)